MQGPRFDRLARGLAGAATRRGTLGAFALGLLAPLARRGEAGAERRQSDHREQHGDASRGRKDGARAHGHGGGVRSAKKKKKKSCPRGQSRCGAKCIDTARDAANCGGCGAACAAGQSCQAGKCTCNGERCAGCCEGTTCQPGDSQTQCGSDGVVCAACAEGQICCDGACRDLSTDVNHCGTCGNACPGHSANECVDGVCQCSGRAACPAGWRCCPGGQAAGGCHLLTHSFTSCGACGSACDRQTANRCTEGVCTCNGDVCAEGETCCNGACRASYHDPSNCGACNALCPGLVWSTTDDWSNANVGCPSGTCTFSCKGQHYDVDGDPENGCEEEDAQTNRTEATARDLGSHTCADSNGGSFSGTIYSDAREHTNPDAAGFDPNTGAAPLWFKAFADGGSCVNDPAINLTMTGGTSNCYTLTFITNLRAHERVITNGAASIVLGSGSYSDDTFVYFKVEKTCGTSVREKASFTVGYHL